MIRIVLDYRVATVHVAALPDADDAPFLELALTAGVPLVTGNVRHFPEACRRAADVLTPAPFLAGAELGTPSGEPSV